MPGFVRRVLESIFNIYIYIYIYITGFEPLGGVNEVVEGHVSTFFRAYAWPS